jgi:hypothetical protein
MVPPAGAVNRHGIRPPFSGNRHPIGTPGEAGPQWLPWGHGGQVGDAGSGDDREDPSGVFRPEEADQGDLPRVSGISESRAQGDPIGGDRVSLRARDAAAATDRSVARAADGVLLANEGKPTRERLTLIRVFEELRGLGYEGSYDAVRRYAKTWRAARGAATAEAYVPLSFAPGEAYQFDWSHEIVLINGTTVTVKVAHVRLCHSRMLFVRAYPRETQEMVFDAHARAFAFFKGTCTRGIYDNMKTAVDSVFIGKDRQYSTTAAFCGCAVITWSIRLPARRPRAGRRGRWRTWSGWCANASSRRGCG